MYAILIFPSLPKGTVTLTWVFVLLFTKPFKRKSFFQNSFLLDKKVEKRKLSFQTDFYYNIKMKKFLFTTSVSFTALEKRGVFARVEVKELEN